LELFVLTKTDENLKAAFAGESQANRLYLAFAKKAEEEGYTQAAKLFKAAAEAETVHALNHVRITSQVKSTLDNLNTAVSGETYEFKVMYPQFLAEANKENAKQAAWSFDVANKVEQVHAGMFQKALNAMKTKKELEKVEYHVCSVCGNTVEGAPPDKCPICGSPKEKFFKPA
jgi:rubrerythrin